MSDIQKVLEAKEVIAQNKPVKGDEEESTTSELEPQWNKISTNDGRDRKKAARPFLCFSGNKAHGRCFARQGQTACEKCRAKT